MKKVLSILLFLTVFSLCMCGQGFAAGLDVFVSISPQKWLCDKLGGTLVTTHVLVEKGQDPHTFEPSPRQVANLFAAKLYFTLDMEFEEQVLHKLEPMSSQLRVVHTAFPVKNGYKVSSESEHKEAVHRNDENEHHHGNEHNHEGEDPHVWLSPVNLQKIATIMAEAMMTADFVNSSVYKKNLTALIGELEQLHDRITRRLAPYKGDSFYVFHPSFGHFAKTYGLVQETVEVEGKSPRPKQLAALIAKAKKDKVKVLFVQPQFDTKSALVVARAIDGQIVSLDALAEDVVYNLELISREIQTALEYQKVEE